MDQVKAPAALVGIANALAGWHAVGFIPNFSDQDGLADEQPDLDHGYAPVEGGGVPVGAGGRIDRVGGKLADHEFDGVCQLAQPPYGERAPYIWPRAVAGAVRRAPSGGRTLAASQAAGWPLTAHPWCRLRRSSLG